MWGFGSGSPLDWLLDRLFNRAARRRAADALVIARLEAAIRALPQELPERFIWKEGDVIITHRKATYSFDRGEPPRDFPRYK